MEDVNFINITDEQLENYHVADFKRIFCNLKPSDAHDLKGRNILGFPQYDSDPRSNSMIPEIRKYIHTLHEEVPYFPYFLYPHPIVGSIFMYFTSLLPLPNLVIKGENLVVDMPPVELISIGVRILKPTAEYCEEIFDNQDKTLKSLLKCFPDNLATEIIKNINGRCLY